MTRAAFATLALVVLALVTVVASAVLGSGDGDAAAGQGGAYAQQAVASIPADWVRVEWYQDAGGGLHAVVVSTPLPPSPTATRTPTATPSLTPPATNTPRPTATSTPTVTRPADASPTPERTPPPTPPPQPTTIPPDNVCYGRVVVDTLRIRTSAGTAATTIGGLTANQVVRVLGITYVGADEWAQVIATDDVGGWAAAWFGGQTYIEFDTSEECLIIRYGETPTSLLIGPHLLYTARVDMLASYLKVSGVVKEVSGDGKLLAVARALNPHVVTIYRHTNDCPPDWMDGGQWFDLVAGGWPAGADWYEAQNECGETSRGYSNTFQIELMRRANERGICLLLYSFSVGTPSLEFFAQTKPVWDWALSHPCQPGRHHSLAMHAYGLGYTIDNEWLMQGWRKRCEVLPGYCERVGIWMTEWEHYEQESDPVDCARVASNVAWARAAYKNTPVRGVLLWSFGALAPWRDLTPCAGVLG